MNRETVIAAICVLLTIGMGWLVDHPNKTSGTIILLVAFAIILIVTRIRHAGRTTRTKVLRTPPPGKPF